MSKEIKALIRSQAIISAAFNFFINGMVSALIHHMTYLVSTDPVSIAIDLTSTCLFIFIFGAFFSRLNLRSAKILGILESERKLMNSLSRLSRHPALFGALLGFIMAVVLTSLVAPSFTLLGINAMPFGWYISFKVIFSALLGGGVMMLGMYAGMINAERKQIS